MKLRVKIHSKILDFDIEIKLRGVNIFCELNLYKAIFHSLILSEQYRYISSERV